MHLSLLTSLVSCHCQAEVDTVRLDLLVVEWVLEAAESGAAVLGLPF